ncbi:5'-nucleotidase C-terminal domain-containing protein [Neobacillus jeddahensis]|uniref:5'-nucleotidase C-terminal domain-containing protein n=1 Tax=Neobacillus jeddahensis TaxID=1461580 RepID=UPI000694EEE7|nr:5'-nucleotidase C-terminal domain-containing protein [Neobacillus jeddahensis]
MKRRHKKSLNIVTMLVLLISLLSPVANSNAKAETAVATDLIISEYIEGSSSNKAIELYNGTGADVDLSQYSLELYSNGAVTASKKVTLTGTLKSGSTFVLYNGQASADIKSKGNLEDSNVINFNGDDPVVLKKGETVIDSIGQVGSRDTVLTDVSLVRNSNVTTGDTIINDAFDKNKEWTNLGKDNFTNLGTHSFGSTDPGDPETPVPAISIADAREQAVGETVTIEGIATTSSGLWGSETFYLQDETAGMFIFSSPKSVKPGDKVKLTGKLQTYKNELEIKPDSLDIVSSGNALPTAQVVTEVTDATQGELLKLENVTITDLSKDGYGTATFQAVFENGEKVRVIHDNRTGSTYDELVKHYKEGDKVHLTGIGSIDETGFHLKTTGLGSYDLVNKPAVYATQAEGVVPAGTTIELKSGLEGAEIYYTTDDSTPTVESTKYVSPIALEMGETTIKAIAVTGGNASEVFSFTYKILNTEGISIHDIQGKGHISDYTGSSVTNITGVVTHVFGTTSFVMQDVEGADTDIATSEAIEVYKPSHGVEVGDKVTVNGTVTEYGGGADLSRTQITGTAVTKTGTAALPKPLVVGKDIIPPNKIIDNDEMKSFDPEEDGIDFWESVEYMRVSFPDALVVGPPYSNDVPIIVESTTNNELNKQGGLNIAKDDYNPEKIFLDNVGSNFQPGDQFDGDVVGVLTYASAGYQLVTDKTKLPAVIKSNLKQEVTHIVPAEDKLTVASYNVENFSNNTANTPDAKVARIAKSFVDNMKSPDIITLIEVQDNDGETNSGNTDATQSYQRLIEAIKTAGGPAYKWTDVAPVNNDNGGAPGGNIRVGYLYNPERVTLVQGTKGTGTEANAWTEAGNLTLNPGVINPEQFAGTRKPIAAEFEFKGQRVVVIGNHLNSKGGDESLWGSSQPPKLGSEAERLKLAQEVNNFIDAGLAKNPDLNVVVTGDMNDFEFTPVLDTLKGNVLTNMVEKVPAEDRFSYFFQGNNQVLDQILVTNKLVNAAKADMIHINANFTEAQGQASDHDPVLVQLDFPDLTIIHTNDVHAALDNMPKTVTALKDIRGVTPGSLLLHAGDEFTGTLYFNEFQGKADLALLKLMGFDAMTFGNHEFDLGSSSEGHQALADFVKGANFPFVSANVDFSKDAKFAGLFHESIKADYENGEIYNGIIKEVNGEKVGIFGLTTAETADISSPGSIAFENYLAEAEKSVKAFEAAGVDRIVALTHIGYDDNAAIDNDLTLAEKVEGIDVIVGGHSHTTLSQPVVVAKDATPTVIVQTGNSNGNLGVLNVEFDENGVIEAQDGRLIAIGAQTADPEAAEVLAPYKAKIDAVAKEEIGVTTPIALESPRTNGDNTKPSVRKNETILGNLITDGMLEKAKSFTGKNVIMALQNGGGIRATIDAGPITVGEVITVLPFNNTLATMDLTGAELKEAFETSFGQYPGENGGFLHVSGGKVEFDSTKPAGERVVSVSYLNEKGEYVEVQDETMYTVATNAFTAKGGDGYTVFAKAYEEGRVTDLGLSDWENFRDHLVSIGNDGIPTEVEGRIVDAADQFDLTVMHTNDVHAALDNMPKTVTAVKEVRAAHPNSLLLHAGDEFTGTLYFNEFQGKADLALLKLMGFDAMTFGNHEFDLGSSPEGHQALADFIKGANFPFVSANVDFSKDAKFDGLFNDSIEADFENGEIYNGIVKEINGEKVGIFGLTTAETVDISSPGSVTFENYLAEAKKAVESFEAQGINKIVALTHIGYDDNAAIDNDLTLAEKVEGIDVIVGGHSHTTLSQPVVVAKDVTPTVIVQTGNSNSNLGVLDVKFDKNGVITDSDGQLIAIGSQTADPEAVEVLAPYKAQIDAVAKEEIGVSTPIALESPRTDGDNTKPSVRKNETILGNLITDGMLEKAKSFTGKNVIMALQNGGGIRATIDAGPITVGEVITVLPFNNTLATMDVTGAELKEAFETSFGQYPGEFGGFLHVSGGKVKFDSTKPAGERVVSVSYLNENGEYVEVQDDKMYTIATNAFTAKGGDGYSMFAKAYEEGRVTDLGLSDWENFRDHLISVGSDGIPTDVEGRIVDVSLEPGEEPGEEPGNNPGKEIKPSVIKEGNKYKLGEDALQDLPENAVVVVEVDNKTNATLTLTKEQIQALKDAGATLVVSNGDVEVEIPASILPLAQNLDIKVKKIAVSGSLVAYDFTMEADGKAYHKFSDKVKLTFKIDQKLIKNANNVKVYYWNEEAKKWELIGGEYKNGEISAYTDHFSTYGVFEGEPVPTKTPSQAGQVELPNTATNSFNILLIGLMLVLAGGILYLVKRRSIKL